MIRNRWGQTLATCASGTSHVDRNASSRERYATSAIVSSAACRAIPWATTERESARAIVFVALRKPAELRRALLKCFLAHGSLAHSELICVPA